MTDARIMLTTVGSREHAGQLATHFVERRLAACVNIIGPITSVYRWKGKVESQEEYLLFIKTTQQRTAELASALQDLHPYELPELIEITIPGGSKTYLDWLTAEVSPQ